MPDYRYELRRGDEVIATGYLSSVQAFEVGRADDDRQPVRDRALDRTVPRRTAELHLVVQLRRHRRSMA